MADDKKRELISKMFDLDMRAKEEKKEHKFWNTQPVFLEHEEESKVKIGPLEPVDKVVRKEPLTLPPGFEWCYLSIDTPSELDELYKLLNENYVEDSDAQFRFDYSREFLHWALKPPGWKKVWHLAVRATKSRALLAFISAVPAHIRCIDKEIPMVEINFLCVHKKLRSKRLAPVLIQEITRLVNVEGIFQAVYTAGVEVSKPFCECRYWHRSLNPKKLVDVKFVHLPSTMKMSMFIKKYQLPENPLTPGLEPLSEATLKPAFELLSAYLADPKLQLAPKLTEEEFRHWLMPRAGVISSYVVVDPTTKKVTDFMSFYHLPSTIVNHPVHKELYVAYSYYNVTTKTRLVDLMTDALILAKKEKFDVFNALDLMENTSFLESLKFGMGDGHLRYYLYNWGFPAIKTTSLGLVLL